MPRTHSRTRRRAALAVAMTAGLAVTPVLGTAASASSSSAPAHAVMAAGGTPGSECLIRVEHYLPDDTVLDYLLRGEVEVTGVGCVINEPAELEATVRDSAQPTAQELQDTVDFIQSLGDNGPCGAFIVIPETFANYNLSVLCPN